MPALKHIPRFRLTETDKGALVNVALKYEQAQGMYAQAETIKDPVDSLKVKVDASATRARATAELVKWANRRITGAALGVVGHSVGSGFMRLRKGYDWAYDHRKWGAGGCAREAAKFLRNAIKRGWL